MRISEVKNWKKVALDTDEWTKLLKKARAHQGLSSQWWWCLALPPPHIETAVAQWLKCCAINQKVAGSIPAGVSGFFIDIKSFRSQNGPGVDSASSRNKYQEYFVWVKADNLPPSCAFVTISGNLNFLEPSGPLRACNGTDFTHHTSDVSRFLLFRPDTYDS